MAMLHSAIWIVESGNSNTTRNRLMKRVYRWGIVLAILLALPAAIVLWLVVKSHERIIISKETTYLTQPLRKDGSVDYVAALNERYSQGVTPENNAAVLFWKAVGPGEIRPEYRGEYFRLLGIAPLPEKGAYFVTLSSYATRLNDAEKDTDPKAAEKKEEQRRSLLEQAVKRPWSAKEFPLLAGWLAANEKPLVLLVEASKRPRRYDPMLPKGGLVMGALLPALHHYCDAARALVARAMLRLNGAQLDEAWADLLACHRLGRLAGQGTTLIDALVGMTIDGLAYPGDQALLQHIRLAKLQVARMRADFASLPPTCVLVEKIDVAERFMYLDGVAQIKLNPKGLAGQLWSGGTPSIPTRALVDRAAAAAADWNQILRMGNSWYDRLVEACRKPTWIQRKAAIQKVNQDLRTAFAAASGLRLSLLISPRDGTSRLVGFGLLTMLSPAVSSVADCNDRTATQFELTNLALALAAYRAEQGSYPAKLADLTPKYVAAIPLDPFNDQALHYTRQGDGYLLYSVGVNGKDDGGKGAADCKEGEGWDDLAIRVPAETKQK